MTWHWAHLRLTECDHWWESEGEWHREWKAAVAGGDTARMEVRIAEGEKWHVADALSGDGLVVELQHSPLAPAEVREREEFYTRTMGGMIWVFDYTNKPLSERDVRVDTASCLRLLDFGAKRGGVIGLVQGEWTEFGRWPTALIRSLLSSSEGSKALYKLHDHFVERRALRLAEEQARREEEQRLREEARAKREEELRLREEEQRLRVEEYLRRCVEAEQQRVERERKLVEDQQRAKELRIQAEEQYQGGKWLHEHPEFTRHIRDLTTMGYVTWRQALPMLQKYGEVDPISFPLINIDDSDFEQIKQFCSNSPERVKRLLQFLWPYLNAVSHLRLKIRSDQRRAAKEAALTDPMLTAMCDAYAKGDLKEATRLLYGAPQEVQNAYHKYVQVSRRQV